MIVLCEVGNRTSALADVSAGDRERHNQTRWTHGVQQR